MCCARALRSRCAEAVVIANPTAGGAKLDEGALTHNFTKSGGTLTPGLEQKLKAFFDKMDDDKNGEVSQEEAVKFWGACSNPFAFSEPRGSCPAVSLPPRAEVSAASSALARR